MLVIQSGSSKGLMDVSEAKRDLFGPLKAEGYSVKSLDEYVNRVYIVMDYHVH
jgi:hypothetical protein